MELDVLKKWYEDIYKHAEWFKNTDLQYALDRKERLKRDFEEAVSDVDDALKMYNEILNRRYLLFKLIKARDPEFEGISDKKEGK